MKHLLFILPIMCLSLNLQAQQTGPIDDPNTSNPVEDSDEREPEYIIHDIEKRYITLQDEKLSITSWPPTQEEENNSRQFTDVEEQFLVAVRIGDIDTVIDFIDVNFMDGRGVDFTSNDELGKAALAAAIVSGDINMVATLWERGARLNEDNTSTFMAALASAQYFKGLTVYVYMAEHTFEIILNVVQNFEKHIQNNNTVECDLDDAALLRKWVEKTLEETEREGLDSVEEPTPCNELIGSF